MLTSIISRAVVMRGVVTAQRVHEWEIAHEPVLVDVAAKMHELVDQVHARRHAHEQPADIRRQQQAEDRGHRDRHQDEHHQRIRRKHRHAPILVVAEAHFLVGEELVMVERVALVDRAQALDVDRPMHDELVHRPFEHIGEQEGQAARSATQATSR